MSEQKRREPATSPRRITATEKQTKALELRKSGHTYQEIADELGYATRDSAHKSVAAALDKTLREPADGVRELELSRLDRMWKGLFEKANDGDPKSIEVALKIMDRRARLTGLDQQTDAPSVVVTQDAGARNEKLDALIAEYQAKHAPRSTDNEQSK